MAKASQACLLDAIIIQIVIQKPAELYACPTGIADQFLVTNLQVIGRNAQAVLPALANHPPA